MRNNSPAVHERQAKYRPALAGGLHRELYVRRSCQSGDNLHIAGKLLFGFPGRFLVQIQETTQQLYPVRKRPTLIFRL